MQSTVTQARVAVISGGSSGIGRAMVAELHGAGWLVFTCARDPEKLARLAQDFPGVTGIVCDVAERAAIETFAAQVLGSNPKVDLVISNAGGLVEVDFTAPDLKAVDLATELRVNLEGAIHLIAAVMPGLKAAGSGSILIVSSGYALTPATRGPIYSAAKAALHSLSKSLRRQLAPLGISVTELLPPLVDTPAVAHRKGKKISAEAVARAALKGVWQGKREVCPGNVRYLPWLLRLTPAIAEKIVAGT